jgi:hypothetical protein
MPSCFTSSGCEIESAPLSELVGRGWDRWTAASRLTIIVTA